MSKAETKAPVLAEKDKATKKEILSYGLGGAACTMPAQFKTSFSMAFMSDVAKLNVGVVGVWISIMTIWDAINDPLIGGIADRTNTRLGKYRPHMIMGSVLWGVITVMLFSSPALSGIPQLVYYIGALFLFSIFYTQFTVPWQAMNSVMSADPHQRNLLLTSRQLFGFFTGTLVGVITMPLVNSFIAKDPVNGEKTGWFVAALIVGVVTIVTGLLCANGVKSKDYQGSIPNPPKASVKAQLNLVVRNKAVICASLLLGLVTLVNAINAAVSIYYLRVVVGNTNIMTLISLATLPASMLIIPFMPLILKKLGKLPSLVIGMSVVVLGSLPLIFLRENATVPVIVGMSFVGAAGFTISNMVCMSLIPDCTDYTELHFGSAQAGFVNAVITFMKKMCQSLSTLIVGGLLWLVNYDVDTAIGNTDVINMILNIKIIMPIALLILVLIVLRIYPITKQYGIEMREKLAVIRAEHATKA